MTDRQDAPTGPEGPPDGEAAEAAEYVLGLLGPDEVRRFEARVAENPDLATEVVAWTEYLARFGDSVPQAVPAAAVKRRIEAEAFGTEDRARPGLWRTIWPYGAGAVAAALIAWVALSMDLVAPSAPTPGLVADLVPEESNLALHVGYFGDGSELLVLREGGALPDEADLELWAIAGDGPPVSLGLVPRDTAEARYVVPETVAALLPGATLAVSREPLGGSPTGAPTGPVLGTAPIVEFTDS
jgi:anti-sigma-K factor RskA